MRERWMRVGILAGVLFAINAVARLVVRIWFPEDFDAQDRIALVALGAVALVMAIAGFVWGRRRPLGEVVGELFGGAGPAALLSVLVGPLIGGGSPFSEGTSGFFSQLALYAGFAGGGALIGLLILIMLGQDHKSRSLRRFAEAQLTKPRRP